ncbi:MAG: dTDP-4-dehydrorhamnose 3,5-epimerase [Acidobacteria bacterium RIFCSPLOWO2_02_FULL_67_36]|nr:MAG: dTDP-4-dehydrorhamnose 3,5-epimerase [Acidobacteria bacterium RIFCSPLOWO2_02_FULL_67_36]OFW22598.1 MAG: dTDP-4-dehydrorhamnose 3,5-epimerase [Acidobacteria bacterium RIFCSPLOWO2_12_FULL_66_21]
MKITVTRTPLPGVLLVDTPYNRDPRGFFLEAWHERDYALAGLALHFVQENHSGSERGVLRGLHYQDLSAPLAKLVRCTQGRIFDVVVDLRVGSPAFGRWFSVELNAEDARQIFVPVGFAHGFQALTERVEVQYKQTGFYTRSAETSIAWDDPEIGVSWPIADPILSERDRHGISFAQYRRAPAFTAEGP